MTLSLQNEQKQHLDYIVAQPIEVLKNVLSQISSGKALTSIKDFTDDDESKASRALLKLLIDSRKLGLSEKDFNAQVKCQLTSTTSDKVEALWKFLQEDPILETLLTTNEHTFRDLEWRLEAKVASRFAHSHPPDPKVVIKFHLDKEHSLNHRAVLSEATPEATTTKKLLVQSNLNNISHIINQLESARTAVSVKKVT